MKIHDINGSLLFEDGADLTGADFTGLRLR